ncbi:helicase-associated domain-containing protein [Brevibacterium album]|uniref:helicase-associated domain-containing protein n=1 Tax=Brevibacterium album TaxID=417948 RepID=UPI000422D866|nr:helicase-associated domain-containing protein [Brevibacterium album]
MRETLSFVAWLAAAPAPWFDRIARTRTDLLRTDAPDARRFATLAASRAAAAAGLEMLDAAALRIVHRAAVRSRIAPDVPREHLADTATGAPGAAPGEPGAGGSQRELHAVAEGHAGTTRSEAGPAAEAAAETGADPLAPALTAAIAAGLLWPAFSEENAGVTQATADAWPLTASAYRVHPEVAALLPMTAAERASALPWETARDPRPLHTAQVSAPLLDNAQAAGAAGAVARALAATGEFARHEVSQLVSGGVGKRDAQVLARAVGLSPARFALTAELASHLGWLGASPDPSDPLWLPTPTYDTAAAAPREEVWAQLVWAWLTHPADVVHVLAGSTPAGERVHLLGRDEHSRTAFPGFPVSHPQILLLRRLVLTALLATDEAGAGAAEAGRSTRVGTAPGGTSEAAGAAEASGTASGRAATASGEGVEEDDLLALLTFSHPLLAVLTSDELAEVLDEAESFGLTASPLGRAHAHALTPLGRTLARWLRDDPEAPRAAGPRAPAPEPLPADADEAAPSTTTAPATRPTASQARRPASAEDRHRTASGTRSQTDAGTSTTPLPADLLAAVAALLPPLETTVTLQSDLTAVASGPLEHTVQTRLEALAEIDTRGQGTVFRVTDETIAAALRAGRDAESLLADLAELSSTGVPSTLTHMVESQASRLTRIRVAAARSVIVVDDPADLDVIFDDPASVATGMRRLSPTVAIASAPADRVMALVETEDRPVLRADTESRGTRSDRTAAPVRPEPPVVRSTRVQPQDAEAHIARLRASRTAAASRSGTGRGRTGPAAAGTGTAVSDEGAQRRAGREAAGAADARSVSRETAAAAPGTAGNAGAASAVDAGAGPEEVLAELSEAAAVRAPVDLVAVSSDGSLRRIRMVPEAVRAGRVLGRSSAGSAVRIAASRIVEVERV